MCASPVRGTPALTNNFVGQPDSKQTTARAPVILLATRRVAITPSPTPSTTARTQTSSSSSSSSSPPLAPLPVPTESGGAGRKYKVVGAKSPLPATTTTEASSSAAAEVKGASHPHHRRMRTMRKLLGQSEEVSELALALTKVEGLNILLGSVRASGSTAEALAIEATLAAARAELAMAFKALDDCNKREVAAHQARASTDAAAAAPTARGANVSGSGDSSCVIM